MKKFTVPCVLVVALALCACGVKRNLKLPSEDKATTQHEEVKE